MKLIAFAAATEAAVGVVLVLDPSLVGRLLLGADLSSVAQAVGRIAGFALLALGLACWPGPEPASRRSAAARGLLAYNVLAAIFFLYLGIGREFVGFLLWPAVALHAALAILLTRLFVIGFAIK
ncbi:MAG: hypothetical protein WB681_01705 [Candidatus Cybelea sp.]